MSQSGYESAPDCTDSLKYVAAVLVLRSALIRLEVNGMSTVNLLVF